MEMKMKMAMKKRSSAARKTICTSCPDIEKTEDEAEIVNPQKNTNKMMYAKNDAFRTWCELCNKPQTHLVAHHVANHADYEVPISRPSPKMAQKLRQQSIPFTRFNGRIKGICWFCEEKKCIPKTSWSHHFLVHTGEKIFACSTCNTTFKAKGDHKKTCDQEPINIFHANSERGIVGFICKDCNYLQIHRDSMINHMENEHGYIGPEENCHYDQIVMIPEIKKSKPKLSRYT